MNKNRHHHSPLSPEEADILLDVAQKNWPDEVILWGDLERQHHKRVPSGMFALATLGCLGVAFILWASGMGWIVSAETMMSPRGLPSEHAEFYKALSGAFACLALYFGATTLIVISQTKKYVQNLEEGLAEEHIRFHRHKTMYTNLLCRASSTQLLGLRTHSVSPWAKACLEKECAQRVMLHADPWAKEPSQKQYVLDGP